MRSDSAMLGALSVIGLCAAVGAVILFRYFPRFAVAAWVGVLFFTPVWLHAAVGGLDVTALTAMTVLLIASCVGPGWTWSHVDTLVIGFFTAIAAGVVIGGTPWALVQNVLIAWLLPYLLGRLVLQRAPEGWIHGCLAGAAAIAAVLVIVEFVTGRNIFLSIPGAESSVWGDLQYRAGLPRAEGAFGHSIAMGASLAISSAFVMSARWPVWLRTVALGLIAIATGLTLSRIGLIGLVLTVVLAIFFLKRYIVLSMRITAAVGLAVAVVIGLPLIVQVFGEAGAEAEGSADYRADLLPLLDQMQLFGISPAREVLATGEDYFGGFRSIDSALILMGLRFGMVPLTIAVVLLVLAVIAVVSGRGSPSSVAVVGQIPAFATVALITQYTAYVWFIAGLSVTSYTLYRRTTSAADGAFGETTAFRELAGAT